MKKNTGLWIDHKEAVLVSLAGDHTQVHRVESGAESHFRPSGGWKSGGTSVAQSVSSEKKSDESRKHQYHAFYQNVMQLLMDSDCIALFGPGEAKIEFAKEVEKVSDLHKKMSTVETCDRLTENQLVAKVKAFFEAQK
jgi:hypothetical protein